ncbi:hypothetical protein A1OE_752 [Candidatus Endolissoclinum faulkneri L2]|uniref:Uncharacterized protein n=1 Tax=Candidatus Endolissoclinum faulkneri L2 TaxID=1193729 RepID=K7Z4M1_9PROT|nr:hypothetical protein A1OE_752 [Candidatus Endolissoclinum faulkneri L2]
MCNLIYLINSNYSIMYYIPRVWNTFKKNLIANSVIYLNFRSLIYTLMMFLIIL